MTIKYTCKGPRFDAAAAKEKQQRRVEQLRAAVEQAEYDEVKESISIRIKELEAEIEKLSSDEVVRSRVGCGFDLSPLIAALPVDGDNYALTCPRCGNKSSVRKVPEDQVA